MVKYMKTMKINCSIIDCDKPKKCKGLCEKHYWRFRTKGDPNYRSTVECRNKICLEENCKYSARKLGLCNSHYTKLWRRKNPDKAKIAIRHSWYRRGIRKRNSKGIHTDLEWRKLLEKYENKCAYCKVEKATTKDHIEALFNGGTDDIQNILPACKSCNSSKHTRNLNDWYQTRFNGKLYTPNGN